MALGGKQVGTMGKSKVRGTGGMKDAVAARKSSSVAAAASGGKTSTGQTGFGIMGNPKVGAGKGLKPGVRAAGMRASRETGGKSILSSGRKKPSDMY